MSGDPRFRTTQWSLVADAAACNDHAAEPMAELCRRYWYPLYVFLRRRGATPEDAADDLQNFFLRCLSGDILTAADPSRGRFRTFMLTACQNHVRNRHRHDHAARRGGGRVVSLEPAIAFDRGDAERRYAFEPHIDDDPTRSFDRRWALELIDRALCRLRDDMVAAGRGDRFEALRPMIAPAIDPPTTDDDCNVDHSNRDDSPASPAQVAARLGIEPGALKVAVHRLRKKFGDCVRAEIAATVDADQVDDELRDLMRALSK